MRVTVALRYGANMVLLVSSFVAFFVAPNCKLQGFAFDTHLRLFSFCSCTITVSLL